MSANLRQRTPPGTVLVAVVWLSSAAALWLFVVRPYSANMVKREVAGYTNAVLQIRSEEQAASVARSNLEKLRPYSRASRDVKVFILIAANHRVLRQYEEAVAAYDRALDLEPTAYLYLNRGVTELAADRPAAASISFQRAVAFDRSLAPAAAEAMRVYRYLQTRG